LESADSSDRVESIRPGDPGHVEETGMASPHAVVRSTATCLLDEA